MRSLFHKVQPFLRTVMSAVAVVALENGTERITTIHFLILCGVLLALYGSSAVAAAARHWESKVIAFLFSVSVALSRDWLGAYLEEAAVQMLFWLVIAWAGLYVIVTVLLDILYDYLLSKGSADRKPISSKAVWICFLGSFALLWCTYLLVYLNQYPGSLSTDTVGQLTEILGMAPYENANPLFTTLFVGIWVKLGCALFGTVNDGVGTYTFVQFTLAACVFAYCVSVVYKNTRHKGFALFAHLVFNCMPYHIMYAVGMWKDTFFGICFLLTLTYLWDCTRREELTGRHYVTAFALVLASSLARNSGWSSLLVFGLATLAYCVIKKRKTKQTLFQRLTKLSAAVMSAAVTALLVISLVYPAFGIKDNGSVVVGLSVPIQQISRVLAQEQWVRSADKALIQEAVNFDIEEFPERYQAGLSDPIKSCVNADQVKRNLPAYFKLWVRLGRENPKVYLDAYVDLTRGYWDFESADWLWDNRIFDNGLGVYRDAKRNPEWDDSWTLSFLFRRPYSYVLQNSAIILWTTLVSLGYANIKKNRQAELLMIPVLMIYFGLMLTSPVALFRYVYGAAACFPLIISFGGVPAECPQKEFV